MFSLNVQVSLAVVMAIVSLTLFLVGEAPLGLLAMLITGLISLWAMGTAEKEGALQ